MRQQIQCLLAAAKQAADSSSRFHRHAAGTPMSCLSPECHLHLSRSLALSSAVINRKGCVYAGFVSARGRNYFTRLMGEKQDFLIVVPEANGDK